MDSSRRSVAFFEDLQDLVLGSAEVADFLTELSRLFVGLVSESVEVVCGVMLVRRGKPTTVASSARDAVVLDEMQYAHADGPCLEAARTGETVYVPEVGTDGRWPSYFAAIKDHGYHSILGVPLPFEGAGLAAVNVYAREPAAFEPELIGRFEEFARQSAKAVRLGLLMAASATRAADLAAAMESRTAIDMAVGVIIGQNSCTQAEAFEILARAASNRNKKLRIVAQELVRAASGETPRTHFD